MAESRRTSLKDLAQILGVSIPTVSRALKNSPEISRELCIKAQKLAKEMNYHPNPFAMSLRKNTPRTIANGYFVIITTSHESYDHEKRNIENLVVCRKIDFEEGKIATEILLSLPEPPDAILAMNDTLAFAAMEVIRNHNLRIPQDIALIGYTDEQHANYVVPRLSAVSHQTYKMGEAACQMLIDKIKGDKKIRQIIIPTCLQVRESSIKMKD